MTCELLVSYWKPSPSRKCQNFIVFSMASLLWLVPPWEDTVFSTLYWLGLCGTLSVIALTLPILAQVPCQVTKTLL